jgi:hypothetical protein
MKHIKKISLIIITITIIGGIVILNDDPAVFIASLESRTINDEPVYNKIRLIKKSDKDIWMMQQSHNGPHSKNWDRLAIVVDKSQSPKIAQFYQLAPGELEWNESAKKINYRVSCFICHANGPRAIRPDYESVSAKMNWPDRLRITAFNLRIKMYGRVQLDEPQVAEANKIVSQIKTFKDKTNTPLKWTSSYENDPVKVKVCLICHNQNGFLGREPLRRQQSMTIDFMVKTGQMPPLGIKMSKQEKAELQKYLDGF